MNQTDTWVDPRVERVRAADLHAYRLAHSWKPRPSPRRQFLLFEEPSPNGKAIILAVPADERGSDYRDGVARVIANLAALENRPAVDVLNDVLQQPAGPAGANGPARPTADVLEREES